MAKPTQTSAAVLCLVLAAAGSVRGEDKDRDAKRDEGILLRTPVGGFKLSPTADADQIGLAVYPGARLVDDGEGKRGDSGALSLGIWGAGKGLHLTLLKYRSDDGVAAVAAFYRKELARYGKVVECQSGESSAADDDADDEDDEEACGDTDRAGSIELRVGSKRDRRIVSVQSKGGGVKLVLLRLRIRD